MTLSSEVPNGAMKGAGPTPRSAAISSSDTDDGGVCTRVRTGGRKRFRRRRAASDTLAPTNEY